jgi:protein-tyrosine phosphatase
MKDERLRSRVVHYAKNCITKIIPQAVLEELRLYRSCELDELPLYLQSRVSAKLGFVHRTPTIRSIPKSVLFVCFGNIMRSPMCEALLNRAVHSTFPQMCVSSAGLSAVTGREAHPWAITAAHELGISLENHRARLLTSEIVDHSDLILAMDYDNYARLVSRFPDARKKVYMLGSYQGMDSRKVEIRDPYYQGADATGHCFRILANCIDHLVQEFITSRTCDSSSSPQL